MPVKASVLAFPSAEPIAWNAAFDGAKIVTSFKPSTVETRSAVVRAPVREVRFAPAAVLDGDCGTVKTVSITWMTPPENARSYKGISES